MTFVNATSRARLSIRSPVYEHGQQRAENHHEQEHYEGHNDAEGAITGADVLQQAACHVEPFLHYRLRMADGNQCVEQGTQNGVQRDVPKWTANLGRKLSVAHDPYCKSKRNSRMKTNMMRPKFFKTTA